MSSGQTPGGGEVLGERAVALLRGGDLAGAERLCAQILAAEPHSFTGQYLLGAIRALQGRNSEALGLVGEALAVKPDATDALLQYGNILRALGRPEEALESYERALALRPDYIEVLNNRGLTLAELGRPGEALESYDRALAIHPDYAGALNNRGVTLTEMNRLEDALASYDRALALRPDFAGAHNNRGNALLSLGRHPEALASYERALAVQPDYADALYNHGNILMTLERFEAALASYDKAVAANPNHAMAWNNRGNILLGLKRFDDALASYERALAIDPDQAHAFGGAASAALDLCDWPRTARIAGEIKARIAAGKSAVPPFTLLGYFDDDALQLRCTKDYVRSMMPVPPPPLWEGAPYGHDKIRIAYLSADFHQHATALLMAELFERHDRSRFEVTAISYSPDDGSEMRTRLKKAFEHFHDVRTMDDPATARLMRSLEIDIAIDLKGLTALARPAILAHRPCPVQVSYLGYPATMGADFIDYIIADGIALPFDRQAFFSEQIVHLPDSYQVNDSGRAVPAQAPSRKEAGLPEQGFVFGCFNNSWKITAPVFEVWMRLLAKVPGSVLWLLAGNRAACENLRREARARGVDPQRLVFAAKTSPAQHLARHLLADLFLDTLPYNAHTTASDALWAGVPLVTCKGETFAGRVAASLLGAAGLPELVTGNLEAYETLALDLAHDAAQLQSFSRRLRETRAHSRLFDADRFRRHIEAAYTRMWENAEHGRKAQSFAVTPGG